MEANEFDVILAEELSLAVHEMCEECGGCCPHDIGIKLAILVKEIQDG